MASYSTIKAERRDFFQHTHCSLNGYECGKWWVIALTTVGVFFFSGRGAGLFPPALLGCLYLNLFSFSVLLFRFCLPSLWSRVKWAKWAIGSGIICQLWSAHHSHETVTVWWKCPSSCLRKLQVPALFKSLN